MIWLLSLIILVSLIYRLILKPHRYWAEKGVPQRNPIPFFGDNASLVFKTKSFVGMLQDLYKGFEGER